MKKNKYEELLLILEEEKVISQKNCSRQSVERLMQIHEMKKGYYACEVEAFYEYLKEEPDTELIMKKYAEYYQLQTEKKKKRIREYLKRINEELQKEQTEKRQKLEKEEDEFLNFLFWCIFLRHKAYIPVITENLFLATIMMLIADEGQNKLRIRM